MMHSIFNLLTIFQAGNFCCHCTRVSSSWFTISMRFTIGSEYCFLYSFFDESNNIIRELGRLPWCLTSPRGWFNLSTPSDLHSTLNLGNESSMLIVSFVIKYQSKQLQTGFQEGMEKLLGIQEDQRIRNLALKQGQDDWTRYDVHEADTLEQEENRDAARQRYQRLYWESVSESGGVSLQPLLVRHAYFSPAN